MKTHYYLLLALLVTLSCSQEKEFSTVAAGSPGKITAVLPSVEFDELTKGSSMGQNGFTLTWDEGDYVNVFSEEGTLCLYRVDGANGLSAVAGFDGGGFELKEGHTYYSIFPAVYTPNMDISSIPVDFSDNYQEANGDASHMKEHAYCISSATCVGGNMQFNYQYPVAFLQLVIEIRGGSGGGLKKVTLSADENLFTKSGSMNLVNGMLTGAEMTNTIEINVNDIAPEIYPDINGERPCYVVNTVVAPFEKSTIKCSITLVDGTEIDFYGDTFGLKAGHAKRLNYIFLNKTPSIAGLRFAAGDLCTTENGFAIANSWQETLLAYGNSVTEAGSASPGRFYFNWVELGDVFSTVSVGTGNTNAIDNTMTVNGFRMPTKNITLSAVYVDKEEEKSEAVGTAYIESVTKPADNKLSFVAILCVPDDCQMMKAGVVVQSTETLGGEELTTENARFIKYSDTSNNHYSSFKYTWTMVTSNHTKQWTVRPYLEYADKNGNTRTIYGEAVSKCVNDVC